jgi:hypothetical protein
MTTPKPSPLLKAAPLWAKSSVKGGQYLTGRLGGVKRLHEPNASKTLSQNHTESGGAGNQAAIRQRSLNRVQFKTHRFRVRSSPSGRLWKAGTTGHELDAV